MKRLDSRGFVLVETIIVAVFVMGISTFLFANFLPLMADYERINNYDTVEGTYKAHEIRKLILREINEDSSKRSILTSSSPYTIYKNYETSEDGVNVTKNELCDQLRAVNYCNTLLNEEYLNVKEIIITSFKLGSIKAKAKDDKNINRALKEYIDYLPKYDKYSSKYNNYNRLIVVYNNGEFSNIEVRYEVG